MKVLSFLKLQMGETYGVIKSISKKKLKGEKKEHLLAELNQSWNEEFGNTDNFKNVWNVIEKILRDTHLILLMLIQWGVTQLIRRGLKHIIPKHFMK